MRMKLSLRLTIFVIATTSMVEGADRLTAAKAQAMRLPTLSSMRMEKGSGARWKAVSLGENRYLASHPRRNESNFLAGREGALLLQDADGETEKLATPEPGVPVVKLLIKPYTQDVLVAVTASGGVYFSRDNGQSWKLVKNLEPSRKEIQIVDDPLENEGFVIAQDAMVYRTRDGGDNWQSVQTQNGSARVTAVAVSKTEPQTLVVGHADGTVFFGQLTPEHDGILRFEISQPKRAVVSAISFVPAQPNNAFLGYAEYAGDEGNLFYTDSAGANWGRAAGEEFPDAPINALGAVDDEGQILRVGSDAGLFVTQNRGASWSREDYDGEGPVAGFSVAGTSSGFTFAVVTARGAVNLWPSMNTERPLACYFKLRDQQSNWKEERWLDLGPDAWVGYRHLVLESVGAGVNKYSCYGRYTYPDSAKIYISKLSPTTLPDNLYNNVVYKFDIAVTQNPSSRYWRQRGIFFDQAHAGGGYRGFVAAISQGPPGSTSCQVTTRAVTERLDQDYVKDRHTRVQGFVVNYDSGRCARAYVNLWACGTPALNGFSLPGAALLPKGAEAPVTCGMSAEDGR